MAGLVIGFILFNVGLLLVNWAMETHRTGLFTFLAFVYGVIGILAGGALVAGSLLLLALPQ